MFALRRPALFSWEPGKESGHGQNHRDKGEALWPRRLLSGVGVGVRKSDEQLGEGEGGTGRGGGRGTGWQKGLTFPAHSPSEPHFGSITLKR